MKQKSKKLQSPQQVQNSKSEKYFDHYEGISKLLGIYR